MSDQHQLDLEKFKFEQQKVERELRLREREIVLQEKSHSNNTLKRMITNPILLATLTAVLGLTADIVVKNVEHGKTLDELKRKQQSDLLMKAFDSPNETVIAMKLALLDSLDQINLSEGQRRWVIEAYARSAGALPDEVAVNVDTPPAETQQDTLQLIDDFTHDPVVPEKPTSKPTGNKPIKDAPKPLAPLPTAPGYCILVGTDVLPNEIAHEMRLAQANYPDARQVKSGRFTLTVVGNYATKEAAANDLPAVRKKLERPTAYIIRNLAQPAKSALADK